MGGIANDPNPNGSGTLSVTMVNATAVPPASSATAATTNGSVTMSSDGSFTYTPNAGFSGPTDTFTYVLSNSATPGKTDTATVTIAVAGRIWFVNSAAAVNGDGRLATPFNILTGAGSADTVDAANDVIFLYTSATNYTGGITLNSGEKIIGQGASQTILVITGFTAPSGNNLLPATGNATDPMITTAGTVAITLGTGNGLHGFTVGNTTATGTDIAGTSFGTLTVRDVTVNGTGRALNLATGTFAAGSTFDLIESNGGSNNEGARINTVGGAFTATTTNIVNPTGTGLDVQSSPAGTSFSFGGTTVNKSSTAGTGVNLNANLGTFAFSSLAVTTNNGTGVAATSSGTVNVTTGSIAATGGPALLVNPTTLGMTFTTVSSTNSATTGISLTSASGSLSITTTTITNSTGAGISETNSSANVNYGTANVSGSGGTGVVLGAAGAGNSGTMTFGDLDISPDANARGLHAVQNSGLLTITSGDIITSGNAAVEITGVSAAARSPLNVTLTKTSTTGGPNGIVLTNMNGPAANVGFIVTGGSSTAVGGDASGGAISGMTGADGATTGNGVYLEAADEVTLRRITINGTNQNHGIRGSNASNITLEFLTVSGTNGNNAGLDEGSVVFDNLTVVAAITSCIIEGGFEDNLNVVNTSGSLNRLTVTGTTFGFNGSTAGNNNITVESQNAGTTLNFTIQSSLIKGARADWLNASNNSSSTMDLVVGGSTPALGNSFDNLGANAHGAAQAGGNRVVTGSVGPATIDIRNNTMKGSKGEAVRVRSTATGALTGTVNARVRNNVIGVQATANSGSSEGSGVLAFGDGGSDMTIAITTNSIFQYNNHGIRLLFGDEINPSSVFAATVTGNLVKSPGNLLTDFNAIHLDNGSVLATDDFTSCIDIGGATAALRNDVAGGGSGAIFPNNADIRVRQRQNTTVQLPGYVGPARDNGDNEVAEVDTYLTGRNTLTTVAANSVSTGGGFVNSPGGAPCAQPSVLLLRPSQIEITKGAPVYRDILFAPEAHSPNFTALAVGERDLFVMAQAAIARWQALGVSGDDLERLEAVRFEIADLPDEQLAITTPTTIIVDENAADYGWFIDASPEGSDEFNREESTRLRATKESDAFGRMDLLTVLTRGLDYVLEHKWRSRSINRLGLMNETLPPSIRREAMPATESRPLPEPVPEADQVKISDATSAPSTPPITGVAVADSVRNDEANTPGDSILRRKPDNLENRWAAAGLRKAVFEVGSPGYSLVNTAFTPAVRSPEPAPTPLSGESVNLSLGVLPPGEKIGDHVLGDGQCSRHAAAGDFAGLQSGLSGATGIPAFLTNDPDTAAPERSTCTTLNVADVSVTKSAGSSPICSTSNITFTINYNNAGPAAALNAVVSDAMPVGTSLVSVTTPATWTRTDVVPVGGNGTITFSKASSPNPDAAMFTIVVSIDASVADGTVIQNTASVTSHDPRSKYCQQHHDANFDDGQGPADNSNSRRSLRPSAHWERLHRLEATRRPLGPGCGVCRAEEQARSIRMRRHLEQRLLT